MGSDAFSRILQDFVAVFVMNSLHLYILFLQICLLLRDSTNFLQSSITDSIFTISEIITNPQFTPGDCCLPIKPSQFSPSLLCILVISMLGTIFPLESGGQDEA